VCENITGKKSTSGCVWRPYRIPAPFPLLPFDIV